MDFHGHVSLPADIHYTDSLSWQRCVLVAWRDVDTFPIWEAGVLMAPFEGWDPHSYLPNSTFHLYS